LTSASVEAAERKDTERVSDKVNEFASIEAQMPKLSESSSVIYFDLAKKISRLALSF
jgi:hypothetical protein